MDEECSCHLFWEEGLTDDADSVRSLCGQSADVKGIARIMNRLVALGHEQAAGLR